MSWHLLGACAGQEEEHGGGRERAGTGGTKKAKGDCTGRKVCAEVSLY